MKNILLISLGGALGAISRYGVSCAFKSLVLSNLWATFLVNSLGCLLIGFFTPLLMANQYISLLFIVGFLGSFTTFSTYSFNVLHLLKGGQIKLALFYFFGSAIVGLLFVVLGYLLGNFCKG